MNSSSEPKESPQSTYRFMAVVAIFLIVLFGVAIFSLSRTTSAPWAQPLKIPEIHSTSSTPLPQFEFSNDKTSVNPESFKGHWTLLNFWSISCPSCLLELPAMNEMALNWPSGELQILTVSSDLATEELEMGRRFLEENQIVLPTIFDRDGKIKAAFNVTDLPRHFLVDAKGMIVWEAVGAFRWNDSSVRDQLTKLMAQQAQEPTEDPAE